MPKFVCASALACILQSAAVASPAGPISAPSAGAVRTSQPVVIDGRADDAIWRTAPAHRYTWCGPRDGRTSNISRDRERYPATSTGSSASIPRTRF